MVPLFVQIVIGRVFYSRYANVLLMIFSFAVYAFGRCFNQGCIRKEWFWKFRDWLMWFFGAGMRIVLKKKRKFLFHCV